MRASRLVNGLPAIDDNSDGVEQNATDITTLQSTVASLQSAVASTTALLFTEYRRAVNLVPNSVDAAHEIVLFTIGHTQGSTDWSQFKESKQVTTFDASGMFAHTSTSRLEGTFLLEVGLMGEVWNGGAVTDQDSVSYYNHRGTALIALDTSMYQHGFDAENNNNTKSHIPIGWHLNTTTDAPDPDDHTDTGLPRLYWRAVGTAVAQTKTDLVMEFPDMDGILNVTTSAVRLVLKPLTTSFLF